MTARVGAPSREERSADTRARVFVWACWVAGLGSSLGAVLANARNVPLYEDWGMVPAMTGHQDQFLSWLWAQNNEHRVPVPRLVYLGLLKLWPDFRVGMIFNIVLMAAMAAGFIVFVRRLRGHTRWTDAFFPVAFLHLGHWENMGWSWELQFVVATALACVLLVGIVSTRALTTRRALWLGGALVAVPLTGATAMPFASLVGVALIPWLRRLRGRARNVLLAAVGLNFAITLVYFVGLKRPPDKPPSPSLWDTLGTGAKSLALALGPGAGAWWLVSVLAVLALVGGAGAVLYRHRTHLPLPLVGFLVGGLALMLGVGQTRAGFIPWWGIPDRYAFIAAPVLCAAYLVYERYGSGTARRLGPALLCASVVAMLPVNVAYGLDFRDWYQRRLDGFAADVKAGVPASELGLYVRMGASVPALRRLRQAGVGVFSRLPPDRPAPVPTGTRVDGLDAGGVGWSTLGGRSSVATLEPAEDGTVVRWQYRVARHASAALARSFPAPQDWRGTGSIAVTLATHASHRTVGLRVATVSGGGRVDRYDAYFNDDEAGTRTVVIPWGAFMHVNPRGRWDWAGPMPLDRIAAVVFGMLGEGPGSMVIERITLKPGHGPLGWPVGSAATRRSLPPWR